MASSDMDNDARLKFAEEDSEQKTVSPKDPGDPWKVLIVDDESDVHEITRIAFRDYTFEDKGLEFFSAYNEAQALQILESESDIAMILLDVVMEAEDSGLKIVEYVRKQLNNPTIRIMLRTGQPGKAPEMDVIAAYDINDYKTKPELTATKLYTSVTACLRAYSSLVTIEKSSQGLEAIIEAIPVVFKNPSFSNFGSNVLTQLERILYPDFGPATDSAYFIQMPNDDMSILAGSGRFRDKIGMPLEQVMPAHMIESFTSISETGGELSKNDEYTGAFKTKEGFLSLLYIRGYNKFTDVQKKLIRIFANTIAMGFDNIRLTREIINTQKEVILTLGDTVETRSQETANHVARVAEFCYLLARKYGLDEETCEMIRLASPMHDVGKIGVPETILNKPGRLTPDEFKIIEQHTQIGFDLLNKSNRPIMKTAAVIALHHHEKWDGSGYPNGLSGKNIDIMGRIAAIADVFDALSHERCYKDAWPMDEIITLYKENSGSHFDPVLVDIFLENIEEFEKINRMLPD